MVENIFRGLGIALVTPFTSSGEIDYPSLEKLIEYQLANGADFLCILATTGETPCLSVEERVSIKQFVVEKVAGRVPILMGCGGNNTLALIEEIRNTDFLASMVCSVCVLITTSLRKRDFIGIS